MAVLFARVSLCSACRWLSWAIFTHREKCLKPGRPTSVWSKFMWNFPGPPGESVFMNCNKKSHFDAATSVPWQEGRFGYISVCQRRSVAWLSLTDTQKEGKASCWLDAPFTYSCTLYLILWELYEQTARIVWKSQNDFMHALIDCVNNI